MFNVNVFAPLMRQSVSVAPFQSYDAYGDASYGSAVEYEAAVVGKSEKVVGADGQEVVSRQTVYLKSDAALRPEDHVVDWRRWLDRELCDHTDDLVHRSVSIRRVARVHRRLSQVRLHEDCDATLVV